MIENRFKAGLSGGKLQVGLWCALPGGYVAEALAGAGYDWLLFDTEHSPGDPLTVLPQLQAVAPYPVAPVVRPASNDAVLIKRMLDLGAQTLLIPYVQDAAEARAAARAMLYPPEGIRGVSALTRATRFGRIPGYYQKAEDELLLVVQVETAEAMNRLEEIAAVEGVGAIFIGPGDLAGSMGHGGNPGHPQVKTAVLKGVERSVKAGKPAGLLTGDVGFAAECVAAGAAYVAIGVDVGLLARGAEGLLGGFRAKIGAN
jgi:4-hydroxy-2-oxoheptanedioate aldolase